MPSIFIETNAQDISVALQKLGVDIPNIGQRGIYPTAKRIVEFMQQPGRGPTRPIRWDSERQRRAFFASDGFGTGIPTGRSGEYQNSWSVIPIYGGQLISSSDPAAIYIGGDENGGGQSLIHEDDWPLFSRIVDAALDQLNADMEFELIKSAAQDGIEMS